MCVVVLGADGVGSVVATYLARVGYDHGQDKAKWRKSLTLFANEVMPQLKDLEPAQ